MRLTDANPIVLSKALKQLDPLLQHATPCVIARVGQVHVFARAPLLEENSRRVFVAKKGSNGLFEGSAKQHRRTCVFLLPTVQITVPILARTTQVLADLGVGIVHRVASSLLERQPPDTGADDSSSHWLAGAKPSKLIREMPLIT